jgi:dihydroorotate dehydrogenase (fumarate)
MQALMVAGADGLVLFNRFYQPDFDLDELEVVPNLVLSSSNELRLPLRWIAILHGRVQADFALTGGVHTSQDVIKAMMAGARAVTVASELLTNGVGRVPDAGQHEPACGWRPQCVRTCELHAGVEFVLIIIYTY